MPGIDEDGVVSATYSKRLAQPEFHITIGDPDDFNEMPLFEGRICDAPARLTVGEYWGQRHDDDAPIVITINEDRSVEWRPYTRD